MECDHRGSCREPRLASRITCYTYSNRLLEWIVVERYIAMLYVVFQFVFCFDDIASLGTFSYHNNQSFAIVVVVEAAWGTGHYLAHVREFRAAVKAAQPSNPSNPEFLPHRVQTLVDWRCCVSQSPT